MAKIINMQFMQYMNLFEKIAKARPSYCFIYNGIVFFVIKPQLVSKAIGEGGENVRKLAQKIGKKVRVIRTPENSPYKVENFVRIIIQPTKIKKIESKGNELIINAGLQSASILIGRNRRRQEELQKILSEYFGIKILKILRA